MRLLLDRSYIHRWHIVLVSCRKELLFFRDTKIGVKYQIQQKNHSYDTHVGTCSEGKADSHPVVEHGGKPTAV